MYLNNLKKLRSVLVVLASASATLNVSAQVLFFDTNDSSTGAWYTRQTSAGTTLSQVTTDTTLTGGALSLAFSGTPSATDYSTLLGRSFTNTTLNSGATLRFQFDFHLASGDSTSNVLRFGLYDKTGTDTTISANGFTNYDPFLGYYVLLRNNSVSGNLLRYDKGNTTVPTNNPNNADYTNLASNSTNFAWGTSNAYTVIFDVQNTGVTNTLTTSVYNVGNTSSIPLFSISGTSSASTNLTTFDGAFIRLDTVAAQTMNFDNLSVTVIPEPSAYAALMGLGLLGFAAYRRQPRA